MTTDTDVEEQTQFTFEQLDERAKDRARDKYRESVGHDDWWDYTYEDAQRMGALIGITIYDRSARTVGGKAISNPDISFELDRGGYLTFAGKYEYKPNAVAELAKECGDDSDLHRIAAELTALQVEAKLTVGCTIEGRITEARTLIYVEASLDNGDLHMDGDEDEKLTQLMRDFASWIHKNLQAEWEHMNSDEAIDERLQDGLLFDEDGDII